MKAGAPELRREMEQALQAALDNLARDIRRHT